jgi:hypothetical protein
MIMKWIPSFYHNGNTDTLENMKIKKLVESNINVKNFSWFYISSTRYDLKDESCDHIKELTKKIQEWMEENDKESVVYKDNEISLVEKQINLSFKTENIAEKLEEELKAPTEECKKIAESIVKNKKFMTKKVLKVKSK